MNKEDTSTKVDENSLSNGCFSTLKLPGSSRKWSYLEHKGVIFVEKYKPRGLHVLYKSRKHELTAFQEELAWYWSQTLDSDYLKNGFYSKNFEQLFMGSFARTALEPETKLSDFDFSPIRELQEAERVKRKELAKEEKQRQKDMKAVAEASYKFAFIDGAFEKVSNIHIEPSTLFKGRGEHPKAGCLKPLIYPEDVALNCSKDAPVPVVNLPGRCWGGTVSDSESTWLVSYTEHITGTKKYVFLAGSSKLKAENDMRKYEKARRLAAVISHVRMSYNCLMRSDQKREKQLGTAVYLMDFLALRAGNEKNEDEADTVGCCSLRIEHVKLVEPDIMLLDFLGKDSIRYKNSVKVDLVAWGNISTFMEGKGDEDDLFDEISPAKVNEYLSSLMPELTAKVFRTFNASSTLERELLSSFQVRGASLAEKLEFYREANRRVALICNHQRATSKKVELNIKAQEEKCQEMSKLLKKIKKTEKKYKKQKEAVQKLKRKIEERKRNKEVSLTTSKINYNDPRISVAWCKRVDVPIEKIFTAVLLEKFLWAMDTPSTWHFGPSDIQA